MPYIFPPQSQLLNRSNNMLLNKRLTTFLSQNTTPQIPTLLLLSTTGKLLTSSSPLSAAALRAEATRACYLWTTHLANLSSSSSSPDHTDPHPTTSIDGPAGANTRGTSEPTNTNTITLQLSHGPILVIRQLACGILFVALSSSPPSHPTTSSSLPHTPSLAPPPTSSPRPSSHRLSSPPSSPPVGQGDEHMDNVNGTGSGGGNLIGTGSATGSEAGSVRSGALGVGRGGVLGIRRRADEVGRWLDGQLEGFVLSVGEGR